MEGGGVLCMGGQIWVPSPRFSNPQLSLWLESCILLSSGPDPIAGRVCGAVSETQQLCPPLQVRGHCREQLPGATRCPAFLELMAPPTELCSQQEDVPERPAKGH